MSRIKWPVRRDNVPPYRVLDAGDHVVCECDTAELADTIVAALNAHPDAGDVVPTGFVLRDAEDLLNALYRADARYVKEFRCNGNVFVRVSKTRLRWLVEEALRTIGVME